MKNKLVVYILIFAILSALIIDTGLAQQPYISIKVNEEDSEFKSLDLFVFEETLFYVEKYYIGGYSGEPNNSNYLIEFYDMNDNIIYSNSLIANLFKKIGFNPSFSKIKLYKDNNLIYEDNLVLCNNNNICEYCEGSSCHLRENSLTCSDCKTGAKDNYCDLYNDSICDPDCNGLDIDCGCEDCFYRDDGREILCKDFPGKICTQNEECTGEYTYASDSGNKCCINGECREKAKEIDIVDFTEGSYKQTRNETFDFKYWHLIILIIITLLVAALIHFIKRKKKISVFLISLVSLIAIVSSLFLFFQQDMNLITGMASIQECDFNMNFAPLSNPIMDNVNAGWSFDSTTKKLEDVSLEQYNNREYYLAIIENRRKNIDKISSSDLEVPLPIILGVIHTEHGGGSPITHPSGGNLCNYAGYCGMMQFDKPKCDQDQNCEWSEFSKGNIDHQVSTGIRYLGFVAGWLVDQGLINADNPDLWYFAAVGYNGGPGRAQEILSKIKQKKGNIKSISWERDVLSTLKFQGRTLIDDGIFGDVRNDASRQMASHAMRTMKAAKEFIEKKGCKIETAPITPPEDIQETIKVDLSIPLELIKNKKLGYYYLNPSSKATAEFDLAIYDDLKIEAQSFAESIRECMQLGEERDYCVSAYKPDAWAIKGCSIDECQNLPNIIEVDYDTGKEIGKTPVIIKFALSVGSFN